jgi:hypothetical protein
VQYGIRFISTEEAEDFILNLAKEVSRRLKAIKRTGRQVTLKIMKRHPEASIETPKVSQYEKLFEMTDALTSPAHPVHGTWRVRSV